MEDKKYELVEDKSIIHEGRKLYRIRALRSYTPVPTKDGEVIKSGDLGGYVEGYHNLSQKGDCWVYDNAKVYGNAIVEGNSVVGDAAEVFGNSNIRGHAEIREWSKVYDNAVVEGYSQIISHAEVYGNAYVKGVVTVVDGAKIHDNAIVYGRYGRGIVKKDSEISGNTRINL
jgi:carbonic anhydrase/acetyltransferase-like protein (isoleucine patch superfamily)